MSGSVNAVLSTTSHVVPKVVSQPHGAALHGLCAPAVHWAAPVRWMSCGSLIKSHLQWHGVVRHVMTALCHAAGVLW